MHVWVMCHSRPALTLKSSFLTETSFKNIVPDCFDCHQWASEPFISCKIEVDMIHICVFFSLCRSSGCSCERVSSALRGPANQCTHGSDLWDIYLPHGSEWTAFTLVHLIQDDQYVPNSICVPGLTETVFLFCVRLASSRSLSRECGVPASLPWYLACGSTRGARVRQEGWCVFQKHALCRLLRAALHQGTNESIPDVSDGSHTAESLY